MRASVYFKPGIVPDFENRHFLHLIAKLGGCFLVLTGVSPYLVGNHLTDLMNASLSESSVIDRDSATGLRSVVNQHQNGELGRR